MATEVSVHGVTKTKYTFLRTFRLLSAQVQINYQYKCSKLLWFWFLIVSRAVVASDIMRYDIIYLCIVTLRHTPPLRDPIFSFSRIHFHQKSLTSEVHAPQRVHASPTGNPGSATEKDANNMATHCAIILVLQI